MRGGKAAVKRMWGAVFDMPTLLQRGKFADLPENVERHQFWKLGHTDFDGASVQGGWGFTGAICTQSLCGGAWGAPSCTSSCYTQLQSANGPGE
jgi:hypothetical protein